MRFINLGLVELFWYVCGGVSSREHYKETVGKRCTKWRIYCIDFIVDTTHTVFWLMFMVPHEYPKPHF